MHFLRNNTFHAQEEELYEVLHTFINPLQARNSRQTADLGKRK